jgi:hypothetical protein
VSWLPWDRLSEGRFVNDNDPLVAALFHPLQRHWGDFLALPAIGRCKSLIIHLALG